VKTVNDRVVGIHWPNYPCENDWCFHKMWKFLYLHRSYYNGVSNY